jgi:hypothetical protein
MKLKICALLGLLATAGCTSSEPPSEEPQETARTETVFDPLVGTIDRARGVQQTIDDQAAERRRQIEEQER